MCACALFPGQEEEDTLDPFVIYNPSYQKVRECMTLACAKSTQDLVDTTAVSFFNGSKRATCTYS